jgi:hypothetical protein
MKFAPLTLVISLFLLSGCAEGLSRLSDRKGAGPGPGVSAAPMEGYVNPAGLNVPKNAVNAHPTNGYWNCANGHDDNLKIEHIARCTLDEDAPTVKKRRFFGLF